MAVSRQQQEADHVKKKSRQNQASQLQLDDRFFFSSSSFPNKVKTSKAKKLRYAPRCSSYVALRIHWSVRPSVRPHPIRVRLWPHWERGVSRIGSERGTNGRQGSGVSSHNGRGGGERRRKGSHSRFTVRLLRFSSFYYYYYCYYCVHVESEEKEDVGVGVVCVRVCLRFQCVIWTTSSTGGRSSSLALGEEGGRRGNRRLGIN